MAQGPLSWLTPLLDATHIIIVKPVVQTASHFRVAIRPVPQTAGDFLAAVRPVALAVETASRFRTYLLDRAWHANPAV
jgi:hypothetical protein